MNPREKILGAVVTLLGVLLGGYFLWSSASSALARRQATVDRLNQQLATQNRTLKQAARATQQLQQLQQRSLPANRELAHSAYQQWLLNLVDKIGFKNPSVKVSERRVRNPYYDQSEFDITAEATLEQLTAFLAAFHSSSDLHRLAQLSLSPNSDARTLDVAMEVEAISLPGSSRTVVGDIMSSDTSSDMIATRTEQVLNRNLFFPANQPPRVESVGAQRVTQGATLRLDLKATDPDTWDKLAWNLAEPAPAGMEIEAGEDGRTAVLNWKPDAIGEYDVNVVVHDDGHPQQQVSQTVRIAVVEPSPDEPASDGRRRVTGFDHATQTYLVGTVASGDQREAWFDLRTEGRLLKLSAGQTLDVGSIVGQLITIDDNLVELETPAGKLKVRVGQSLTEAADQQLPPASS